MGSWCIFYLERLGNQFAFFFRIVFWIFKPPFLLGEVFKQIHFIGVRSMVVILLTGGFTGMVLGMQGFYTLSKFGALGFLGSMVSLSIIKELGPVLSALMVTGRAGSAIAAEIGIMRISEQLDALDTMALHPIKYIVVPKVIAALICVPLLTAVFDVIGIIGGYATGVNLLGASAGSYISSMETHVQWQDVHEGLIKSISFAVIISAVCCFEGYYTDAYSGQGAEGVGHATTTAVVISSVMILVWDYFITSVLI